MRRRAGKKAGHRRVCGSSSSWRRGTPCLDLYWQLGEAQRTIVDAACSRISGRGGILLRCVRFRRIGRASHRRHRVSPGIRHPFIEAVIRGCVVPRLPSSVVVSSWGSEQAAGCGDSHRAMPPKYRADLEPELPTLRSASEEGMRQFADELTAAYQDWLIKLFGADGAKCD